LEICTYENRAEKTWNEVVKLVILGNAFWFAYISVINCLLLTATKSMFVLVFFCCLLLTSIIVMHDTYATSFLLELHDHEDNTVSSFSNTNTQYADV
jgi:hypothetical protein